MVGYGSTKGNTQVKLCLQANKANTNLLLQSLKNTICQTLSLVLPRSCGTRERIHTVVWCDIDVQEWMVTRHSRQQTTCVGRRLFHCTFSTIVYQLRVSNAFLDSRNVLDEEPQWKIQCGRTALYWWGKNVSNTAHFYGTSGAVGAKVRSDPQVVQHYNCNMMFLSIGNERLHWSRKGKSLERSACGLVFG